MPMIPLPAPPGAGGMPMDPMMGAPPPAMGGGMGPVPLPPVPAEIAGQAAAALVPGQIAQTQAETQAKWQEVLAVLQQQLAGAPNPAAEAAQGMPAAMVAPGEAAPLDPNDPYAGGM